MYIRRMTENEFAPLSPGNFADISYLVENWKLRLFKKNVCTLFVDALVC